MNPTNRERDVMASLGSLADTVEEVVESAPWDYKTFIKMFNIRCSS